MELHAWGLHLALTMQTEIISILCTGEFSLATGTSELGSYYHPHFTDSETESLSDFPMITPSSICSKAVLETFHTLCSVSAYSLPFSSLCPYLGIHHLCIHSAWFLSSVPSILFLIAKPCQMSLSFHCLCQILDLDTFSSVTHHLPVGSSFQDALQTKLEAHTLALSTLYPHCFQPSKSEIRDGGHRKANTSLWCSPGFSASLIPISAFICSAVSVHYRLLQAARNLQPNRII